VLKRLINENKPDIIFIYSECNIKNKEIAKACTLDGFKLEISSTMEARTCCFIKSGLSYTRRTDLEKGSELIVIDLMSSKHRLLGLYKPFKLPQG